MKIVEPKVFHIGQTTINKGGWYEWLGYLGVENWSTNSPSGAEALIEACGRRCYKSFATEDVKPGDLNKNISRVREGNDIYIDNILKVKHGSVIEHGHDTFAIENVSRVFTHEVVRHRLCNFSQESLRFVRPTSLDAYFPDIFKNLPEVEAETVFDIFTETFTYLEDVQAKLVSVLGMDNVKIAFGDKKKLQSAMRRLMPIGLSTGIVITTNHRNWRWLIETRTARHSEEEIRKVYVKIAEQLADQYPNLYADMYGEPFEGIDEITFKHGRV